jgi:2-keto-4-pentenoate hydratase
VIKPSSTPDRAAVEATSDLLAKARRNGQIQTPPPPAPHDADEAFAIQRAVMERLDETIGGWKAAGLNPDGAPLVAPIHRSSLSSLECGEAPEDGWILEVELAFRLARDVAPGEVLPGRAMEAVSDVLVCFEFCRSRVPGAAPLLFLADGLANDRVVLGSGIGVTGSLDLGGRAATLRITGRAAAGGGTDTHASAIATLDWLLTRHPPAEGFKAGQIVITGSLTGTTPFLPGDTAEAEIEGIGAVRFTAARANRR